MAIADIRDRLRLADRTAQGKALLGRGLERLTDAIYPPRCLACPDPTETAMGLCGSCWREVHFLAGPVCDLCGVAVPSARGATTRIICESCTHAPPPWDQGRAAIGYDGVGRKIVTGLKSRDRLDSVPTLARWMTGAGAAILSDDMIVVPVPIHWKRRLERRFNQSAELARAVAARAELPYEPDFLARPNATAIQRGKSREQRHRNVANAIEVPKAQRSAVAGRHILLIDDVMTTGATLGAATEALRGSGAARVSVLVLARVELAV